MIIDKQNGDVAYNDEHHSYWNVNDDEKYISVTTLIHSFTQEFDKDFWSAYKALEKLLDAESWKIEKKALLATKKFNKEILNLYDISESEFNEVQQDILDQWAEENRKSCERGTKIHAELENSMYKAGANVSLKKFGIGGKFECRKDYCDLDLEYGVYPEYLVSRTSEDGILRLAGQVDLIVKQGNEITIMDWKGLPLDTEIPTLEGWSTIKDLKEGEIIKKTNKVLIGSMLINTFLIILKLIFGFIGKSKTLISTISFITKLLTPEIDTHFINLPPTIFIIPQTNIN